LTGDGNGKRLREQGIKSFRRTMRIELGDFVPPILARSLRHLVSSVPKAESSRGTFLTYANALEACSSVGYEEASLVNAIFERTRLWKDTMLQGGLPLSASMSQSLSAVLLALQAKANADALNVVDFGGACGTHYFQLRPLLPAERKVHWIVVETPAMVNRAKYYETAELHFAASLPEAKDRLQEVDLLHSSGALQYVPDPDATVRAFLMCHPAFILLNRLALAESGRFIAVQESLLSANGPGPLPEKLQDKLCYYPITYLPKGQLKEMLSRDYHIHFELEETWAGAARSRICLNSGFFAERR
jgi:putative methyltransferase (TIGR04325 family)